MKLKLVVVDLQLTRRQKVALSSGIAAAFGLVAAVASADVPNTFVAGQTLKASDLNANFAALDSRTSALEADGVWSSYTPTITSDGSAASRFVRGDEIRYVRFGRTVCLQGMVIIGEQAAGFGGTFIKVSLPPGLPGIDGTTQAGIGTVVRTGDSTTLFAHGGGAIEDDVDNVILAKGSAGYFFDGDARPGAGVLWVASGCYETN